MYAGCEGPSFDPGKRAAPRARTAIGKIDAPVSLSERDGKKFHSIPHISPHVTRLPPIATTTHGTRRIGCHFSSSVRIGCHSHDHSFRRLRATERASIRASIASRPNTPCIQPHVTVVTVVTEGPAVGCPSGACCAERQATRDERMAQRPLRVGGARLSSATAA